MEQYICLVCHKLHINESTGTMCKFCFDRFMFGVKRGLEERLVESIRKQGAVHIASDNGNNPERLESADHDGGSTDV